MTTTGKDFGNETESKYSGTDGAHTEWPIDKIQAVMQADRKSALRWLLIPYAIFAIVVAVFSHYCGIDGKLSSSVLYSTGAVATSLGIFRFRR